MHTVQPLDPGVLRGGGLEPVLREVVPADPDSGRVPEYRFDPVVVGKRAGHLNLRVVLTPAVQASRSDGP